MKTFAEFAEEVAAMNTNAGIAGTGTGDVADWKHKKKKKAVTKNYIEILGKRKKRTK